MTKLLAVRIDADFANALDDACRRAGLTRSRAVKHAVEQWIRHQRVEDAHRRDREGYARRPVTPDEFGPVLGARSWPK